MRAAPFVFVPLLAALIAVPAAAQISANIRIGPNTFRRPPIVHIPLAISVGYYRGDWRVSAAYWRPTTIYRHQNRYYERPYRDARPVIVYRHGNRYYFAPQHRDWDRYRQGWERREWRDDRRGDGRDDRRNDRRDDRRDGRGDDRRDDRGGQGRGNGRG